jgi:two-component response regulator (ARR-A family)
MVMEKESKFHVLSVDDRLFDRKMIERLNQKSSFKKLAYSVNQS